MEFISTDVNVLYSMVIFIYTKLFSRIDEKKITLGRNEKKVEVKTIKK